MRNLAASQFEPAVASRRSQRVPSIKPREVVAWASRTRCRVTVRRLCTARTVASAAKRHFLTFLDFYGDLQRDIGNFERESRPPCVRGLMVISCGDYSINRLHHLKVYPCGIRPDHPKNDPSTLKWTRDLTRATRDKLYGLTHASRAHFRAAPRAVVPCMRPSLPPLPHTG